MEKKITFYLLFLFFFFFFSPSLAIPFERGPHLNPPLQQNYLHQRQQHTQQQPLTSYHSLSCLGTQSVQLPRGCPGKSVRLTSFPKSGRTWLRCIVSGLEHASKGDNVSSLSLSDIDSNPGGIAFSHGNPHPYQLTAEKYKSFSDLLPNRPTIFLARDPRDVVVSNFHEVMERKGYEGFENPQKVKKMNFSSFLKYDYGSFLTHVAMMNRWGGAKGECPRLVLYYENLSSEGCWRDEYMKLAMFLGFWLSKRELEEVREKCSFHSLKHEIETNRDIDSKWKLKDKENPNSAKVRKGVVGGYQEETTENERKWMEKHALFEAEFLEYDSRYRGTLELTEEEKKHGVKEWDKSLALVKEKKKCFLV